VVKRTIDLLRAVYRRQGVVPVLGAGASLGSGVPTWEDLLVRLADKAPKGKPAFQELRSQGFSLPVAAANIESMYGSRQKLFDQLWRTLYADTPFGTISLARPWKRELLDNVQNRNPTLRAVAALCCAASGTGFIPNGKVRAVVTFNLDTILEEYVSYRYGGDMLQAIDHPAARTDVSATSVYHMHGFVKIGRMSPGALILTEADYFDFFSEPFGAFTYTFLYLLREASCVFIGLSMRDDNLRRLLYYSARERGQVFSKMGRSRSSPALARHFALMARQENSIDDALESGLRELGVRIIWLDGYDEIPSVLKKVYESTVARWADVF